MLLGKYFEILRRIDCSKAKTKLSALNIQNIRFKLHKENLRKKCFKIKHKYLICSKILYVN